MNFRHLDPRDEREGMSGAGDADARVWEEFFDKLTGELRVNELEKEFKRLWGHDATAVGANPKLEAEMLTEAARALEQNTLSNLMSRYDKEVAIRPKRPPASAAMTQVFERSALVVAIARRRANYRCELPGCEHPIFVCADGTTIYSEVHHIVPLSEGGEDVLSNVACVCPAHHREAHAGKRARDIEGALKAVRIKDPTS